MFKIRLLRRRLLLMIGLTLFAVCLFSIGILHTLILSAAQTPDSLPQSDIVIVLGAGLRGDQLSLTLRYRMETALAYLQQHPHLQVIVSGGRGPGETISEAAAMRNFLLEQGIANARIIVEERSTSTYENLLYSRDLLPKNTKKSLIVTSDFHMFRALMLADHLGYEASGLPAPSVDFLNFRHIPREWLAIVKSALFDIR